MPPSAAAPVRGVHVQTCASPGADVRTRQGPPTRAAVRRNALRGERVRLRSERQGRIRLPPVCRQTKRHVGFPGRKLPRRRSPQRAHRCARTAARGTTAGWPKPRHGSTRRPRRRRRPTGSAALAAMPHAARQLARHVHALPPLTGTRSSCPSTRASRTTAARMSAVRSSEEGVHAGFGPNGRAAHSLLRGKTPLVCGADSPAAAGTVRRIVSMGGTSRKTPRKIRSRAQPRPEAIPRLMLRAFVCATVPQCGSAAGGRRT